MIKMKKETGNAAGRASGNGCKKSSRTGGEKLFAKGTRLTETGMPAATELCGAGAVLPRDHSVTNANTATGTLKLIAMVLMIVDHIGAAFFSSPYVPELRIIGRVAFPLYAWCMALGCDYTRNIWKYLFRVLILFVISQPVYALAMKHEWNEFNIFATLFLGLAGVAGIRYRRYGSQIILPLAVLLVSMMIRVDYGWQGVLFIMVLYLCRKDRGTLAAVMIAFCLFWGYTSGSSLTKAFGLKLPSKVEWLPNGSKFFASIFRMQTCALLALPLMLIPMKNIKLPKWFSYSVYPVHLLIIWIVRIVLDNIDTIRSAFEKLNIFAADRNVIAAVRPVLEKVFSVIFKV